MLRKFEYDRFSVVFTNDKNDIKPYKVTVIKGATKGFVWELTRSEYIAFLENILEEEEVIVEVERECYD